MEIQQWPLFLTLLFCFLLVFSCGIMIWLMETGKRHMQSLQHPHSEPIGKPVIHATPSTQDIQRRMERIQAALKTETERLDAMVRSKKAQVGAFEKPPEVRLGVERVQQEIERMRWELLDTNLNATQQGDSNEDLEKGRAMRQTLQQQLRLLQRVDAELAEVIPLSQEIDALLERQGDLSVGTFNASRLFQDQLPPFGKMVPLTPDVQDVEEKVRRLAHVIESCRLLLRDGTSAMVNDVRVLQGRVTQYRQDASDTLKGYKDKLDGVQLGGDWRGQVGALEGRVRKVETRVGGYDAPVHFAGLNQIDVMTTQRKEFQSGQVVACGDGLCQMKQGTALCVQDACVQGEDLKGLLEGGRVDRSLELFLDSNGRDLSGKGRHFSRDGTAPAPLEVFQKQRDFTLVVVGGEFALTGLLTTQVSKRSKTSKHYTWIKQGAQWLFYENGKLVTKEPVPAMNTGSAPLKVSKFPQVIAIFSRPLLPEEVMANYRAMRYRYNIPDGRP